MKTSELTGATLDWAVAKCESEPVYSYSTNWLFGGPIIEREKICIEGRPGMSEGWAAHYSKKRESLYFYSIGQTPLVAAMRCYVASKLGDDVDIPEELK